MKLTDRQIENYNRNGFVLVKDTLIDADTQPVIDELEEFIDRRAKDLLDEGKITDLCEDAPFDRRYGKLLKQSSEIGKGMDIMFMRGRAMFEFLINKNLLDTIESIIGSEITCNPIQHVRSKPPSDAGNSSWSHGVPWHQDAAVMMKEAENSNVVTCWLPLTESTIENGCLQILPIDQNLGYLRHQKEGGTMIVPDLLPKVDPVFLECNRGDLVLMSRFAPHRSVPNRSDRCRWSLDLRYQPTGQHTGRTAHPDFVVRSPKNPRSVLTDHQTWCDLWIDAFENPRGFAGHRSE